MRVESMAALFPRWASTLLKLSLLALLLLAATAVVGPMLYVRTAYNTGQTVQVTQPVEFDHRHHVGDDGIACVYCHTSAETAASAGYPATEVCMGCHNQIWNESPLLAPVRNSWFERRPIAWNRVHNLADFVFFDHSVHVQRGIGCVACHGRVDSMARVYQVESLHMGWCLDCHRDSRGQLSRIAAQSRGLSAEWGGMDELRYEALPETTRRVTALTTCTACHR